MIEKIKNVVENYPNRIAYSYQECSITYQELWDKVFFYANLLRRQGQEPVIIYGGKEIEVVIAILACLMAKRAYIPLGVCTPLYRIKKIIELTHSSLILSERDCICSDIMWCSLEQLSSFKEKELIEIDNEIAYIIFTSGSTGVPKGVPISYSNLNHFIQWICGIKPLCDYQNITVLNQASFSFDLSVADFYYSITSGHTLVAIDFDLEDDFSEVFQEIQKVQLMVITPTFMKLCLLDPDFCHEKFSHLKCVYFCGEMLEKSLVQTLWERFPTLSIINAYGPTEATSAVSGVLLEKDMLSNDLLPVGEVNAFATPIEIVQDEIVLKGESVFHGYLGGVVGGYFEEDGVSCYRTGDIGYIEDGYLFCKGRRDSQIKFKGYRIELGDIESHLKEIDGVSDAAVVAKYNEQGVVKMVKAFVEVSKDIDVKEELSKMIPGYMMPKQIVVMDRLPMNSNGKIDRVGLSQL